VPVANLRRELRRIAALGVGSMLFMTFLLSVAAGAVFALRWLLAALACWSLVWWQAHHRLQQNHDIAQGTLLPSLGLANRVTLGRGLLIAATAGFLATPGVGSKPLLSYIPALLYTLAALGDALDGYIARRLQQVTRLGRELDMALDALGLLVAPLLAVFIGKLHGSYLLVSAAYYLFQQGLHWRRQQAKPVYSLPPSRLRRLLAGFQMGLVATVLWPPLPAELTRPVGVLFMVPVLAGFIRDWLHVSGRAGRDRDSSR